MKIFLDTSSLFKLYHKEDGTDELLNFFNVSNIEAIFLSEITKIEFDSIVWKKYRKREIKQQHATIIIGNFEKDLIKYSFVKINPKLIDKAKELLNKYGYDGLRTLDSLQLASAIELNSLADLYISEDKLLFSFFNREGLPTFKN